MTIAVGQLIDSLERSGIRVWVEAGQLRFRAPQGAMTDEKSASTIRGECCPSSIGLPPRGSPSSARSL
jgi:hypothetical protein